MSKRARQTIEGVADTVSDPSLWTGALGRLVDAFGAEGATLFTPALDPTGSYLRVSYGDAWNAGTREYFDHWVTQDPWLDVIRETGALSRAGQVCLSEELLPQCEYRRTAYYNDYGRRYVAGPKLTLKLCDASDRFSPVTHLTFGRHFEQGPFGEAEKKQLQALWPELQRGIQNYWINRPGSGYMKDAEEALDAVPMPALVLREDVAIEYMNRAAQQLNRHAPWISSVGDRLSRIGDIDSMALARNAKGLARGTTSLLDTVYVVSGKPRSCSVRLVPIAESSVYARGWPRARTLAFIDLHAPVKGKYWIARLADFYGLTPTESRVAEAIGAGKDPTEVAELLGISVRTVRTHLHAIFAKTSTTRQAELVHLLHSG